MNAGNKVSRNTNIYLIHGPQRQPLDLGKYYSGPSKAEHGGFCYSQGSFSDHGKWIFVVNLNFTGFDEGRIVGAIS